MVSSRALFGSCLYIVENVLPKFGISVDLVDGTDEAQWRQAIRPETKAVFLESVSNPMLEVVDLECVCELAHRVGALVIADNALATPVFQRSVDLGVDIIVYSATKHIDGQGRCLGGVVLGTREYIRGTLEPFAKHTGGAMSPFNAWVMLKGLETLELRCHAQTDAAYELALKLERHPKLSRVVYPHLPSHAQYGLAKKQMEKGGTVFSIELGGGKPSAFRFLNALRIIRISNNFGDTKSLVTHPATTTHQRLAQSQRDELGISDGLIRISVGLEDPENLFDDLSRALDDA